MRQITETERVAAEQAERKAEMAAALERAATAEAAEHAATEAVQREAAEAARGEDVNFRVYIEGHNQTDCYRATVETTKPTRVAGGGRVDTKMRVAAAWLGDKKTLQRDISELRKGDQRRLFDSGEGRGQHRRDHRA